MTEPVDDNEPILGEVRTALINHLPDTADLVQATVWADLFHKLVHAGTISVPVDTPAQLEPLFEAAEGNPLLPPHATVNSIGEFGRSKFPIHSTLDFFEKCYSTIKHIHELDPTKMTN